MTQRVLVVDDEDSPRMSVELALTMAGYSVVGTADGREAIQQIVAADDQSREFDLLITDLKMPHMSGLELLDELNAMGVSIPTLVITGFADNQTIKALSERGCNNYYEKPLDPKTLTNRVGKIIQANVVNSSKWEAEILPPNPFHFARLETAFNTILAVSTSGNQVPETIKPPRGTGGARMQHSTDRRQESHKRISAILNAEKLNCRPSFPGESLSKYGGTRNAEPTRQE